LRTACGADFGSTAASLETSAFASALRLSISNPDAGRIAHWSRTASVTAPNAPSLNLSGLFATPTPSAFDDWI
jgi:hypothetical protein